jgi:hypothetical protein
VDRTATGRGAIIRLDNRQGRSYPMFPRFPPTRGLDARPIRRRQRRTDSPWMLEHTR